MFADNIKQRIRKALHLTTKIIEQKKFTHHMLLLFPAITLVFQSRVRAHLHSFISRHVNMFTICAMCVRVCMTEHMSVRDYMCVHTKYVSLFPYIWVINYKEYLNLL